jgi:hypothetical protein
MIARAKATFPPGITTPILTNTSTFGDKWAVPNAGEGRKQPTLLRSIHRTRFIHLAKLIEYIRFSHLLAIVERLIHKILLQVHADVIVIAI